MQGSNAFREAISKHRTVAGIYDKVPALPRRGFVAPSASVIGDVTIGEKSSVWYGTVLRGDANRISIGSMTNIQDNTVIHAAKTSVGVSPRQPRLAIASPWATTPSSTRARSRTMPSWVWARP